MADKLDSRLTHALETPPHVRIEDGVAARIALRAATEYPALHRTQNARVSQFGPLAIRAASAVLLLAMVVSARLTASLTVEYTLAAEFIALTLWLTLRPKAL
jgi:hypothetical protein